MTTKLKICQNCRYCVNRKQVLLMDCLNSMVSDKEYQRCLMRSEEGCDKWNRMEEE